MSYTPPTGNAVNFTCDSYRHNLLWLPFRIGALYDPPLGDDVDVTLREYVYPNEIDFTVPANADVYADGAFSIPVAVSGDATFTQPYIAEGAFSIPITVDGEGEFIDFTIDGEGAFAIGVSADATAAHGVAGSGAASITSSAAGEAAHGVAGTGAATISFSASGAAAHGVAGTGAVSVPFSASGVAIHERYEVKGEVRLQGVLVNRRVRVYRRDTGAMVGDTATIGGKFTVQCGFAAREHYLVPIDLANDAEDFTPPVANRVVSILAMDA